MNKKLIITLILALVVLSGCVDYQYVCNLDCKEECMKNIDKVKHPQWREALQQKNNDDYSCQRLCKEQCK